MKLLYIDLSHLGNFVLLEETEIVGKSGAPDELPSCCPPLCVDKEEEIDFRSESGEKSRREKGRIQKQPESGEIVAVTTRS